MIKLIEKTTDFPKSFCKLNAFGTRIEASLFAFEEGEYENLFWQQTAAEKVTALLCRIGGTVTLAAEKTADFEELASFLQAVGYSALICEKEACDKMKIVPDSTGSMLELVAAAEQGKALSVTQQPDLKGVFELLKNSGFENLGSWENWLADISMRVKLGSARVHAIIENGRVVSTVSELFIAENAVFLGAVATDKQLRGRGLGSALVCKTAAEITGLGKRAQLFCANGNIIRFYEQIGFKRVGSWAQVNRKEN